MRSPRSLTPPVLAGALAALLAFPAPLLAKPAKPTPTQRVRSDQARAVELVERAAELYRAGKLVEAAALFLEAYALSNAPAQLRNAAKAYTDAGHLDDALIRWREYAAHPKLSDVERAEAKAQVALVEEKQRSEHARAEAEAAKRAAEEAETAKRAAEEARARSEAERAAEAAKSAEALQASEAARTAEAARAAEAAKAAEAARAAALGSRSTDPAASREPAGSSTAPARLDPAAAALTTARDAGGSVGPYVALGAGGILAVAAGVVFAHASARLASLDERLAQRDAAGRTFGVTRTEAQSELDGVNLERTGALALGAAGAAAIGAGLVWALLGDEEAPASDARGAATSAQATSVRATNVVTGVRVTTLADGAWLGWSGRW